MSPMVRKAPSSRMPIVRNLTERACNDPQRMMARKTEARILEKMPSRAWLSCTAVSRLICAPDDRKTRARLDRLVRDGKSNASASRAAAARSICSGSFRELQALSWRVSKLIETSIADEAGWRMRRRR
jgi:hypothetical protein